MTIDHQSPGQTQLVRDSSGEKTMYVAAAVCAVISVGSYLLVSPMWILWVSIPMGLLAALSLSAGRAGCYSGTCPSCGIRIQAVDFKQVKPTLCQGCRQYYEGSDGWLSVVEPGRVEDEPVFCSPLPEKMAFPECCCVCAAPATRLDQESGLQFNAAWLVVGRIGTTKVSLKGVPYCDQHRDGVAIDTKHIRFRSYPYMRAFCELNRLAPGPAKSLWDEFDEQAQGRTAATNDSAEEIVTAELVDDEELTPAGY